MTWDEIAERAEKATGPDRELDLDIGIASRYGARPDLTGVIRRSFDGNRLQVDKGREGWSWPWDVPYWTRSVDAVLALIAEKLPGWTWSAASRARGGVFGRVTHFGYMPYLIHETEGATPALALLAAFSRAMAAQETRQEIAA